MLWWADIPDGQRGLYGTRDSTMTNGIYADSVTILVSDPDPLKNGLVLFYSGGAFNSGSFRIPRPLGSTPTVGIALRQWLDQLPSNDLNYERIMIWRTSGNSTLAYLTVDPTGRLKMVIAGGATYYSGLPAITANGYYHIEGKYTHGVGALCSFEIRVEGTTVSGLQQTNVAGTDADVGIVAGSRENSSSAASYIKDLVLWDGTGGAFDDFQGSVQVHDLYTDEDVTLGGWTTSTGATGWPLIQDAVPSNTLTLSGLISVDDDKVSMDGKYYQWTAGSVDAGTPAGTSANPWRVAYGGTDAQALENLFEAVNASGVAGTTYSTALTQNANVKAAGYSTITLDVEARDGITDSYDCTEDGANMSWFSTSSFVGGPTDASYISGADVPLPAVSKFKFTPLPVDVTSVRGLISIQRAYKTDGGDAQLQVALSTDDVAYDTGTDRTLTTAPTWYFDVSVIDAATGNAYLPSAVDTLRARIDRTV